MKTTYNDYDATVTLFVSAMTEPTHSRSSNSMTKTFLASKERHDKRTEQVQQRRDTNTIYAGLCSLDESEDGNTARVFMNKTAQY
jgi:hypothetical protein